MGGTDWNPRDGMRAAIAFALLAFAACLPAVGAPGPGAAATPRAILVRGAYPVRGIPFFSTNALPALVGAYRPAAAVAATAPGADASPDETSLWFTRETVVLGAAWKRAILGGSEYSLLARPQGTVLALRKSGYYLFFGFPAGVAPDDPSALSFVRAFDRKFSAFMANAPTDAELSFPAYVDY